MKKLLGLLIFLGVVQGVSAQTGCWKDVAAADDHTLAIGYDGKLYGWGANMNRELGIGFISESEPFTLINGDTDWEKVFTSYRSHFAIKSNGTLWAWGAPYKTLGTPTNSDVTVPSQVNSDTDWASVYPTHDNYTLALKTNGTLWGTGSNVVGQLNLGSSIGNVSQFTQIGTANNWSTIIVSKEFSQFYTVYAIKTDGTLWGWGTGLASADTIGAMGQIGTATDWVDGARGGNNSYMLKTNGDLYAAGQGWGYNIYHRRA